MKRRTITAGIVLVLALAGCLALGRWFHPLAPAIVRELPPGETLAYLDLAPLRAAGALAAAGAVARAPSYAAFVRESGFDFERDLDAISLSLSGPPLQPDQATCILAGRFGPGFLTYLQAHAQRRLSLAGRTAYQFPGWARPLQAITVLPLDSAHVLVTNAPAPETASARTRTWWPGTPALWQVPLWSRPPIGYVAVDALRLAAARQLDGSLPPWRGSRSLRAGLRASSDAGVTLQGEEQALSPADAADSLEWAQQEINALRPRLAEDESGRPTLRALLDRLDLRQQGSQLEFTVHVDATTLQQWRQAR